MRTMDHLTETQMKDLKAGRLSKNEKLLALKHIGECEQCADSFAGSYGDLELLTLSPDFKTEIFFEIEKEKKGMIKEKAAVWKRELCFYSFKVSIAACIALLLLFSGTLDYGMNMSRTMNPQLSGVNVITENLRGFSDKLIDFEVQKN